MYTPIGLPVAVVVVMVVVVVGSVGVVVVLVMLHGNEITIQQKKIT